MAGLVVHPKHQHSELTERVRHAAMSLAIGLPVEGSSLAMIYWDRKGACRVFVLSRDNFHFACRALCGVYKNHSEIIPL